MDKNKQQNKPSGTLSGAGTARRVAFMALFTALGMIVGYIESLIPLPVPVPGIKLGLANIVGLVVLYHEGRTPAAVVSVLRVLLLGLLFQGVSMMIYGLFGSVFSLTAMLLLHRTERFSIAGISVVGGIFHNLGQLTAAWLFLNNAAVFWYFPVLMIVGGLTGFFTGSMAKLLLSRLPSPR